MQTAFPGVSQSRLKQWASLAETKFRREEGLFLAEGVKTVSELLKSDWPVEAVLVLPEKSHYWETLIGPLQNKLPVYQSTRAEWKKLSQDKEPEGVLAIVRSRPEPSLSAWLKTVSGHVLIGHEISNPQNLGALARSAQWFGFGGIILSANSVDWTNPKVIRASMGSVFHLKILSDLDLSTALPEIERTCFLIGSDVRDGVSPEPLSKKAALLLGNESHGLPDYLLNQVALRWRIPGGRLSDSLSLPQAAAIMMYEMTKHPAGF